MEVDQSTDKSLNNNAKSTYEIMKEKYGDLNMKNTKELSGDQLRSMIDCKHITKTDVEYPPPSGNYKPYWK